MFLENFEISTDLEYLMFSSIRLPAYSKNEIENEIFLKIRIWLRSKHAIPYMLEIEYIRRFFE